LQNHPMRSAAPEIARGTKSDAENAQLDAMGNALAYRKPRGPSGGDGLRHRARPRKRKGKIMARTPKTRLTAAQRQDLVNRRGGGGGREKAAEAILTAAGGWLCGRCGEYYTREADARHCCEGKKQMTDTEKVEAILRFARAELAEPGGRQRLARALAPHSARR